MDSLRIGKGWGGNRRRAKEQMRHVTTTADLKRWGYVEQPDGTWKKPDSTMDRLEAGKHAKQEGALDQGAQKKRCRKTGRKGSNRKRQPAQITVTMVAHIPRYFDDDNLANALKPVRDEVADWLGVDDGDGRIRWECGQVETRGKIGVSIKVEHET